ncbi:MAG: response regulator transcription factor [Thermoflexus sp.]|nr:response regulator transcription factor [Thermoflexus sp.]
MKKILLIEDDAELACFLAWQLEQDDDRAPVTHSGPEGLPLLQAQRPDQILLDRMLPSMDGWEVLRAIRATSETPAIIIPMGAKSDIVRGLEAGADGYLTQSFTPCQLLDRVRAMLQRYESTTACGVYDNSCLYVDWIAWEVWVDGHPPALPPTEFRLLSALSRFAGLPLTHDFPLQEVWGEEHVQDRGYLKLYMASPSEDRAGPQSPALHPNRAGDRLPACGPGRAGGGRAKGGGL